MNATATTKDPRSSKRRLVLYHDHCLDGFTAAWVAWIKFGDADTDYVPANYGDPVPDVRGRDVLVLDFSYPRSDMLAMAEAATSLRVLDHHKTARAALEGLPFATFDMNRSGAGMAWDELHGDRAQGYACPWPVQYVEDRDLWRFALPQSKAINAWIGACRRDTFADWDALNATTAPRAAEKGESVLVFIDHYVSTMAMEARTVEMAGYRVPMVNAPPINISELLAKLAQHAPFAVGWFQRRNGAYIYSLRSRAPHGVDVSEIAKKFGGGGHREAAGFTLDQMLYEGPETHVLVLNPPSNSPVVE